MEEKLLYRIQVNGSVQGVGFRWSAVNEARKSNINGFVKNLSNGSVYIEAEGTLEQLSEYVNWCKKGPVTCVVESVDFDTLPPVGYKDFRIKY